MPLCIRKLGLGLTKVKGFIRIFYGVIVLVILWVSFFHLSKSRNKIEFYVGNISYALPFPGHINIYRSPYLKVGEIVPNCGIELSCPTEQFAVHLHSGRSIADMPKICVGGKYVIHKDINNSGKGFNIVIVDPHLRKAVSARGFGHLDKANTEEVKSFLTEDAQDNDIIIIMTFDDASSKLSNAARHLFGNLGSGMIQNLQYKSQWFMITQKGLQGFSPFEELHQFRAGQLNTMDRKFCIPTRIEGRQIVPDPPANNNSLREKFCDHHVELDPFFCSGGQKFMDLEPAILINHKLMGNAIFSSPVVVLGGQSLASLSLTLETVISQPGIQPQYVFVIFNSVWIKDVPELCRLFGFIPVESDAQEYWEILQDAFEAGINGFSSAFYITVIEEGVVLAPDFLQYLAETVSLLKDPTIIGISAWNPNGYDGVSSKPEIAYRVEGFFGTAFTINFEVYKADLKPHMSKCCNNSGWEGWSLPTLHSREVIIPDVSRCFVNPTFQRLNNQSSFFRALFYRRRETNLDLNVELQNVNELHAAYYDSQLKARLVANASVIVNLTKSDLQRCITGRTSEFIHSKFIINGTDVLYVIPYKESKGQEGLKLLCHCFGLFHGKNHSPVGVHQGIMRFSHNGKEYLIMSNRSSFFSLKLYAETSVVLP